MQSTCLAAAACLLASVYSAAPASTPAPRSTPAPAPIPQPNSSVPPLSKDQRMQWWRAGRFGMFIHWGLYSTAAGRWDGKESSGAGEWLLTNARVDPLAYRAALMPRFNPVKFDAAAWAALAKEAGMQYVVITTKHHDGFCLWESDLTDYDVASTPFKRDIMKELSDAVRAQGLRMGWYHSIMDWTHPDYLPRRAWDTRPTEGASFERYVQYMHGQLKELLTRYGPIDVLWFDGEWENTWTHDWGKRTDDLVRALQPQIIVNNRVDSGRAGMEGFTAADGARGDYGTPEQTIPANGMPGRDWETCMTMNDTWGFKESDTQWKSSRTLIRMLCDIASKGGNFLLNVGPRGDGTIPPESVQRLREMGAWLKVNGAAIYGTHASPFPRALPWGRVTQASGAAGGGATTLYLMVFDWPHDGVLRLPGLGNDVKTARVLGANAQASAATPARTADGVQIALPAAAPSADCSVVELVIAGAPVVAPMYLAPDASGTLACAAQDAQVTGSVMYEERHRNLGYWTDPRSTAAWEARFPNAGRYRVALEYASEPGCAGDIEVTIAGRTLRAALSARTGWSDFATETLGEADIPGGVPVRIEARAASMKGQAFINLRSITLTPVR